MYHEFMASRLFAQPNDLNLFSLSLSLTLSLCIQPSSSVYGDELHICILKRFRIFDGKRASYRCASSSLKMLNFWIISKSTNLCMSWNRFPVFVRIRMPSSFLLIGFKRCLINAVMLSVPFSATIWTVFVAYPALSNETTTKYFVPLHPLHLTPERTAYTNSEQWICTYLNRERKPFGDNRPTEKNVVKMTIFFKWEKGECVPKHRSIFPGNRKELPIRIWAHAVCDLVFIVFAHPDRCTQPFEMVAQFGFMFIGLYFRCSSARTASQRPPHIAHITLNEMYRPFIWISNEPILEIVEVSAFAGNFGIQFGMFSIVLLFLQCLARNGRKHFPLRLMFDRIQTESPQTAECRHRWLSVWMF